MTVVQVLAILTIIAIVVLGAVYAASDHVDGLTAVAFAFAAFVVISILMALAGAPS